MQTSEFIARQNELLSQVPGWPAHESTNERDTGLVFRYNLSSQPVELMVSKHRESCAKWQPLTHGKYGLVCPKETFHARA